ncbi:phospholipid/cholesterol/gamma-HCH transport system ATP-binding protein [Ereboglobus sp. PH5-5]|uniref:ABC transporter ATP-binding protein n=1 Tax=Ereboglobus sp. PH5-5 TaxID=2940529 RepID=UPI0024050197|nr:ATP-binding cassette domain-containing protein [Ereboglobus sp. PH5-5]MDF9831843.1 phospholipid/cholesterol/gamma-HCH transport system ATP-binding protein [Ereboglobus sp. PH5-5]
MNTPASNTPSPHRPAASGAQTAIGVENLRCGYDGRVVIENINFTVKRGEIFFIVGGSGCGKSTLLKHMIGLHQPTAGRVVYFGEDFTNANLARRREHLKTFGVLYQSAALWSALTLRENVALPLEEYTTLTKQERDIVVAHKLAQVGLSGFEDYYPSEISGGMKKRAGLARALALDPKIVFFDEPSAGLDPVTSRNLDNLLLSIRDSLGTTLIIVSHELASIYGIADRILMLDREARGAIAEGPPAQLAVSSTDTRVRDFLQRGALARPQRDEFKVKK